MRTLPLHLRLSGACALALAVLALGAPELRAQAGNGAEAETVSTLAGVYTSDQAAEGAAIFEESCVACHADGYFTASTFQRSWSGRAIYWLFRQIRNTMPEDNPGSLDPDEVSAVLAYILSLNEYPTGEQPLPHEDDPLRLIVLEAQPETQREAGWEDGR